MGLRRLERYIALTTLSLLSAGTLFYHITSNNKDFQYNAKNELQKSLPSQNTALQILPGKNSETDQNRAVRPVITLKRRRPKKKNEKRLKITLLQEPEYVSDICALVHKHYWGIVDWLKENKTSGDYLHCMSPGSIRDLKGYFGQGSLWGDGRRPKSRNKQKYYDDSDDCRTLAQVLWTYLGPHLFPELISMQKKKVMKTIALRPDSAWYGYHGGKSLECPGGFSRTCELQDGWSGKTVVDAILTSQHTFQDTRKKLRGDTAGIYFAIESPYNTPALTLNRQNDFLASYWRGSDIVTPYYAWTYYDPKVRSRKPARDYAIGKTKMAAVFMSHCKTPNNRLDYIKELSQHIPVDIYGLCGDLSCEVGNCEEHFESLKKDYRFYLAFENSNCRDYITAKFFLNALGNDVVPVVMGGHPSDYEALAPKNSYIHVNDFKSPEELGKFLLHLAGRKKEYNKYFEWKGTGELVETQLLCRTCAMLWYADLKPPGLQKQPFLTWSRNASTKAAGFACTDKGEWYW